MLRTPGKHHEATGLRDAGVIRKGYRIIRQSTRFHRMNGQVPEVIDTMLRQGKLDVFGESRCRVVHDLIDEHTPAHRIRNRTCDSLLGESLVPLAIAHPGDPDFAIGPVLEIHRKSQLHDPGKGGQNMGFQGADITGPQFDLLQLGLAHHQGLRKIEPDQSGFPFPQIFPG
jgi:hypothetical protein